MTLRRTMDARFLNEVANHPSVRGGLGGDGHLTFNAHLADRSNVALVNDFGGFITHNRGAGLYEVHTMFLRGGRGQAAVTAMEQLKAYLFTQTDCVEIVSMVPDANPIARAYAERCGFNFRFYRPVAFLGGGSRFYGVTMAEWIVGSEDCLSEGRAFHQWFEAEKLAAGISKQPHPDEDIHDRYAGAAVLMAKSANLLKAVDTYNRWAVFAGYAPISVAGLHPPMLDVVEGVIGFSGGKMEAVLCLP